MALHIAEYGLLAVSLTGKMIIFMSSFAPQNLVSRDRVVPGTRYPIWYECIILLISYDTRAMISKELVHLVTSTFYPAHGLRKEASFRWRASYQIPFL